MRHLNDTTQSKHDHMRTATGTPTCASDWHANICEGNEKQADSREQGAAFREATIAIVQLSSYAEGREHGVS